MIKIKTTPIPKTLYYEHGYCWCCWYLDNYGYRVIVVIENKAPGNGDFKLLLKEFSKLAGGKVKIFKVTSKRLVAHFVVKLGYVVEGNYLCITAS